MLFRSKHFKGEADTRTNPTSPDGDVIYDMVKDLEVIFGKGSWQSIYSERRKKARTLVEKEIYILGFTLLENPRGSLCNRRDAHDEKCVREPAKLLGRVWENERYTGIMAGPPTYARSRRPPESREVSRSCQLRSYQRREGDLF